MSTQTYTHKSIQHTLLLRNFSCVSLGSTLPETNIAPRNGRLEYVGILLSYWGGLFSGAILVICCKILMIKSSIFCLSTCYIYQAVTARLCAPQIWNNTTGVGAQATSNKKAHLTTEHGCNSYMFEKQKN